MADYEIKIKDKEVIQQLEQRLEQKMKEACVLVQDSAKQRCPVDTGRLQGSLTYQVQKDGNEVEGLVGTNVEYAPYVEAGTSRQTAKPFLKPAGDESRDRILQLFQGLI